MRGTRAEAERAFAIRIRDYNIGQTTFHANDDDPRLPRSLARKVESIAGLSDLAQPKPAWKAIVDAFCSIGVQLASENSPDCFQKCNNLYGGDPNSQACKECIGPVKKKKLKDCETERGIKQASNGPTVDPGSWLGMDGTGQTVGLIEFDNFSQSDVNDYINAFGLPAKLSNLSEVNVGGAAPIGAVKAKSYSISTR
ncbi:MAG: hypothetical protein ACREQX_04980 [Candidatus Binataceae bacterium]